ncbi:hypothetical protein ABZW11_32365 [Nonomuraea sp. NPDC004580]|uniref:hypothetical protein n=1 Tax=Nonomuraea sp. NPDC004580 TaxID=3154552 RepID=UPI0033BED78D
MVPGKSNPDENEYGAWGIVGGGSDEHSFYMEVLGAEEPRKTAQFVVDAVTGHAGQLRLESSLVSVQQERARQRATNGILDPSNPNLIEEAKLAALIDEVGGVGRVFNQDRFATGRDELDKRLYAQLAQVAATAVAWMECIHARSNADSEPTSRQERAG